MKQLVIKTLLSLLIIVSVSEISKRSTLIGGIIISLPILSILAMFWLWMETKNKASVAALSTSVFWLVLPSLVLFISLPIFLKKLSFGYAMLISSGLTIGAYYLMIMLLNALHIKL